MGEKIKTSTNLTMDLDPRIKTPTTVMIVGPTQCGKSYLAAELLTNKDKVFNPVPQKVLWFYALWQPLYDELREKGLVDRFIEGIDDYQSYLTKDESTGNYQPSIIVIDDLQREVHKMADMFERGSHHENATLIFISQNVFHQGKNFRDVSLNTHYMFVFKNNRDSSQIQNLGRQVYPQNSRFVSEAYEIACQKPHGYLMFDFHPGSVPELKVRTDIFNPDGCTIFMPKKKTWLHSQ